MSCWNFEQWLAKSLQDAGLPEGFTDEEKTALGEDVGYFVGRHRERGPERPQSAKRSGALRGQSGARLDNYAPYVFQTSDGETR